MLIGEIQSAQLILHLLGVGGLGGEWVRLYVAFAQLSWNRVDLHFDGREQQNCYLSLYFNWRSVLNCCQILMVERIPGFQQSV